MINSFVINSLGGSQTFQVLNIRLGKLQLKGEWLEKFQQVN
jgi:hypothetical protein